MFDFNTMLDPTKTKILTRLKVPNPFTEAVTVSAESYVALFIDTETTGLSRTDMMWEIACIAMEFDPDTLDFIQIVDVVEDRWMPSTAFNEEAAAVTGVDLIALDGQREQHRERLLDLFATCDIIVCHNAQFDRFYLEQHYGPIVSECSFGCTYADIPASIQRGNRSLTAMAHSSGFYFDHAHTALADTAALVGIAQNIVGEETLFSCVVSAIETPHYYVAAVGSPYESKDALKSIKLRWNPDKKVWGTVIPKEKVDPLVNSILKIYEEYGGKKQPLITEVDVCDRFSDRAYL